MLLIHVTLRSANIAIVLYIEYLSMARAGLLALEQWDPKSKVHHTFHPNMWAC